MKDKIFFNRVILQLVDMSKGYFLTTIINQALPFLLLPILTRYLTPAEYGTVSLYNFFLVLSYAIVGSPVTTYMAKFFFEKEKSYSALLIGNGIILSGVMALAFEILILIAYKWVEQYVQIPILWMALLPFCAWTYVIFSMGLAICRNTQNVWHFSIFQILCTIFNVALSILFVCSIHMGWKGRSLGIIGSYVISAIIILIYLHKRQYLNFSYISSLQKSMFKFVLPLSLSGVNQNIISQSGIFFMQLYFTKDIQGIFSLAFQVAFCVKLLVETLILSWHPFLYKSLAEKEVNKIYISRLLIILYLVIIFGGLGVIIIAKPILWIMTTPDFYAAKQFIPWFCIGFVCYGLYAFISPILIKCDQQKTIGAISVISLILMIISNVFFAKWFGYMGIMYAYCFTYAIMAILQLICMQRHFHLPWTQALIIWRG